jgi:hypothetical protein
LEGNEDFFICSHNYSSINDISETIREKVLTNFLVYENHISSIDLMKKTYPMLTLSLCVRNIFKEYSYPLEGINITNGDSFLISWFGQYGKGCHLDFTGAAYRRHENGISSSLSFFEKNKRSYFFSIHMASYYENINTEVSKHYHSKKEKYIFRLIDFSKKKNKLKNLFFILKLACKDSMFTLKQKIIFFKRALTLLLL